MRRTETPNWTAVLPESALLTICVSNDIATLAGYLEAVRMFYCKEAQ